MEDQKRDDEALTPVELLLYEHFRYLDCPSPVDTTDPEDCASMAVEVIRFLTEKGVIRQGEEALTCQDEPEGSWPPADHFHECARERGHRSRTHRCRCNMEWQLVDQSALGGSGV